MTKLEELISEIEKGGVQEHGFSQAEMDFIDLLPTLYVNDLEMYKKYYWRYTNWRNSKIDAVSK